MKYTKLFFRLLLVEDDEFRHVEIEEAGEAETYHVTDDRFNGVVLQPVNAHEEEVDTLHHDELYDERPYPGCVITGKMAPEGPGSAIGHPLFPNEEIRYDEIRHGGDFEGDDRSYPVTSPVIAAENIMG